MEENPIDTSFLFDLCDREKKGYLTEADLKAVCPQLDDDEVKFIFESLDADRSGKIDRDEFLGGFQNALIKGEDKGFNGMARRASVVETPRDYDIQLRMPTTTILYENVPKNKGYNHAQGRKQRENIYKSVSSSCDNINFDFPCQDDIVMLYEQLQSAGMPEILGRFEKVIGSFCKEIEDQKDQNIRLQQVFESERNSYSKRMDEVENEIDQTIMRKEREAREEERRRLTKEKEEMRQRLESEMAELNENISRLKHVEMLLKNKSEKDDQAVELKSKLQELLGENLRMKENLADAQLELAVIKSELVTVRADYETRKGELLSDNEAIFQTANQTENLQRQLQLLFEANKKLHDTNDSLREALEQKALFCRQYNVRTPSPAGSCRNGVDQHFVEQGLKQMLSEVESIKSFGDDTESDLYTQISERPEIRELNNDDTERRRIGETVLVPPNTTAFLDEGFQEPTGPPQRTFRVVMCGDASVGKTSIVARIVRGVFIGNLPSTLGVDFNVKNTRLDNMNVAIQLWDTAGQERFRSLCKSYFRRADGAILCYDCSVERTFLHVRDWISVVRESTTRPIPIIICGNKIDLRPPKKENSASYISVCDGESLSKDMDAMFTECSALDGSNVEDALLLLTREMMANEDVEIYGTGMVLEGTKQNSSCCSRR